MAFPSTTLIVLAWNRWDLTRKCLATLRETDLTNAEVLVVDNGSTDETPAELRKLDWVRVLTLPSNLGFVRGNNAGIEAVDRSHDVVLLNNDLVFTQRDWLQRLRAAAWSSPDIGIAGCRLVLPDGRLLHAGTYILPDTLWGQQIGSLEKDVGQYPGVREVEGIIFACAYLRREVIAKIGGLWPRLRVVLRGHRLLPAGARGGAADGGGGRRDPSSTTSTAPPRAWTPGARPSSSGAARSSDASGRCLSRRATAATFSGSRS